MNILDKILEENEIEEEEEIKTKEFSLIGSQCPHCETGKMYTRYSKYGDFLGCSNYPKCTYVINNKYDNDIGTAGHKELN